ncbi:MAG: class I SAM-dependent methyltransferase [Candidatus Omnitrophica bacterium]|nr:class I SAM-dependent methyltransferase [Candidatus Omnitrophota bacterium]MBU1925841.1 class I SAM-dependent methyltransferase [Candidatus Omnitrophota bacterium]
MLSERVYTLDTKILKLFASKGGSDPQIANANGVKVRRIMQITRDFAKAPLKQLKILDLACGEGVYAIEAALRGAEVIASDARTERMNEGVKAAESLGLKNLRFEQTDVRNVNVGSQGSFDVIFFLGILYHLDKSDVFAVLKNIYDMCLQFMIIDTHISLRVDDAVEYNGKTYYGQQVREHAADDSEAVRRDRALSSLDNVMSFWFTKESLFQLLNDIGFTSVCVCDVPLEPFKPQNRITIIAKKGEPVKISSYPWVNDKSEEEIKRILGNSEQLSRQRNKETGIKGIAKSLINDMLSFFGLEIRRL